MGRTTSEGQGGRYAAANIEPGLMSDTKHVSDEITTVSDCRKEQGGGKFALSSASNKRCARDA